MSSDSSLAMMRDLREQRNLTQVQVGNFLDVTQSQVSQWELGGLPVGDGFLPLLSRLLGVSELDVRSAADRTRASWLQSRDLRLGDRIRELRTRDEISREALADGCDCTAGAVALWEGGNSSPSRSRIHALADAFDLTARELLVSAGLDRDEVDARLETGMMERTPLAMLLRQGRTDAGLTQAQVAGVLGSSQVGMSSIETSVHLPAPAALAAMTRLYGLDRLDVMAARYETRVALGHVPEIALPWPLAPADVPRVRWFRQLRAHMGITRSELAEALGIETHGVSAVENVTTSGLPSSMRDLDVLRRLGVLGATGAGPIVAAFDPDYADLIDLLDLDGIDLVNECASVAQLLRLLHFRGTTWTEVGEIVGTSRQSPVNWARGGLPNEQRVVAMGQLFQPPVAAEPMRSLHSRSKSLGSSTRVSLPEAAPPVPGTPDWIFSDSRLESGESAD